jgi:hypothetical protein
VLANATNVTCVCVCGVCGKVVVRRNIFGESCITLCQGFSLGGLAIETKQSKFVFVEISNFSFALHKTSQLFQLVSANKIESV